MAEAVGRGSFQVGERDAADEVVTAKYADPAEAVPAAAQGGLVHRRGVGNAAGPDSSASRATSVGATAPGTAAATAAATASRGRP